MDNEPAKPDSASIAEFRDKVETEILRGLPNEQDRRTECLRNVDYYCLRGAKYIPRRDAESQSDFLNRPKRSLPFTHRVIRVLCSKLYAPGPQRVIENDIATSKWLEQAYADNLVNSLWQRADKMATLNGMSAFQVAATGDPKKPLTIRVWNGWHEVIPFEVEGRAGDIGAVVTIDTVDQQTRYTYWTSDFYKVYETEKLRPFQVAGGRTAKYCPDQSGPNPYGIIPFSFAWYELPTGGVDTVHGLGNFLSDLNCTIDVEMSDMAQAVSAYHAPMAVIYDGDVGFQPIKKFGSWIRVNSVPTDLTTAPTPKLEYLQAKLDINGGWANIVGVIDSELEALGIPLASYRMNSATLHSGAALMAEQMPLVEYATERMEPAKKYETDLKDVCLKVAAAYYDKPDLTVASELPYTLSWPGVTLALPGQERDLVDTDSVTSGYESPIMVVMRRFSLTREQALAHMQQVADDHAALQKIMGAFMPATAPPASAARASAASGGMKGGGRQQSTTTASTEPSSPYDSSSASATSSYDSGSVASGTSASLTNSSV